MLQLWEVREDHHICMQNAMKETGKVAKDGMILYFNGPKFFEYIKTCGHTSADFDNCDCRKLAGI